jgi:hypothetical protein
MPVLLNVTKATLRVTGQVPRFYSGLRISLNEHKNEYRPCNESDDMRQHDRLTCHVQFAGITTAVQKQNLGASSMLTVMIAVAVAAKALP